MSFSSFPFLLIYANCLPEWTHSSPFSAERKSQCESIRVIYFFNCFAGYNSLLFLNDKYVSWVPTIACYDAVRPCTLAQFASSFTELDARRSL